jgi:hypothetical protein
MPTGSLTRPGPASWLGFRRSQKDGPHFSDSAGRFGLAEYVAGFDHLPSATEDQGIIPAPGAFLESVFLRTGFSTTLRKAASAVEVAPEPIKQSGIAASHSAILADG